MTAIDDRADWRRRPWWMQPILGFCLFMAVVYMPFDMFLKPVAGDQEVWFGLMLTGWAAKATEPLHWAIYGAGAYGFWNMKRWMWPWAAVYSLQVAIAMLVFSATRGSWVTGMVPFAIILVPTIALYRARHRFDAV